MNKLWLKRRARSVVPLLQFTAWMKGAFSGICQSLNTTLFSSSTKACPWRCFYLGNEKYKPGQGNSWQQFPHNQRSWKRHHSECRIAVGGVGGVGFTHYIVCTNMFFRIVESAYMSKKNFGSEPVLCETVNQSLL